MVTAARAVHDGQSLPLLERAAEEGAFTLADRSTFIVKQNDLRLAIVFQGDEALQNTYVVVEPTPGASVNGQGAHALAQFVL